MVKQLSAVFAALGLVFGLAACGEPTAQQKEAAEWKAKCDAAPNTQECKDWEEKYKMGG